MIAILTQLSCGHIYSNARDASANVIISQDSELINSIGIQAPDCIFFTRHLTDLFVQTGSVFAFVLDQVGFYGLGVSRVPGQFDSGSGYIRYN